MTHAAALYRPWPPVQSHSSPFLTRVCLSSGGRPFFYVFGFDCDSKGSIPRLTPPPLSSVTDRRGGPALLHLVGKQARSCRHFRDRYDGAVSGARGLCPMVFTPAVSNRALCSPLTNHGAVVKSVKALRTAVVNGEPFLSKGGLRLIRVGAVVLTCLSLNPFVSSMGCRCRRGVFRLCHNSTPRGR